MGLCNRCSRLAAATFESGRDIKRCDYFDTALQSEAVTCSAFTHRHTVNNSLDRYALMESLGSMKIPILGEKKKEAGFVLIERELG